MSVSLSRCRDVTGTFPSLSDDKTCLTDCSGVREQRVGDQHRRGRQLRRAGTDLRHPESGYSQSQDQREAVGHRQRQLQENTHGIHDSLVCVVSCVWSDTKTTRPSLQGSTLRKRKMYEEFLRKVSILGEILWFPQFKNRHRSCHLCEDPNNIKRS